MSGSSGVLCRRSPFARVPRLAMESLPFPRRLGPAPSATAALAAELVRPLADGLLKSPKPLMKKQAVKRHHHKHNLRHRYEFLETLGKGTYGKVKKARESSGRLVSAAPWAAPAGGLRARPRLGAGRGAGAGVRCLLGGVPASSLHLRVCMCARALMVFCVHLSVHEYRDSGRGPENPPNNSGQQVMVSKVRQGEEAP